MMLISRFNGIYKGYFMKGAAGQLYPVRTHNNSSILTKAYLVLELEGRLDQKLHSTLNYMTDNCYSLAKLK